MQDVRLKLSPPWITYVNMLEQLFDGDPQIAFNIKNNGREVTIACNNGDKCAALAQLLPDEKKFGNISLIINIDGPMSNKAFATDKELFETAFEKNPAFSYAICPAEDGYHWVTITYIVFKNCVVQFFNDNLDDCHGVISTLYQDIAKEIFADAKTNGPVVYNTDVEKKILGRPLGEWP